MREFIRAASVVKLAKVRHTPLPITIHAHATKTAPHTLLASDFTPYPTHPPRFGRHPLLPSLNK